MNKPAHKSNVQCLDVFVWTAIYNTDGELSFPLRSFIRRSGGYALQSPSRLGGLTAHCRLTNFYLTGHETRCREHIETIPIRRTKAKTQHSQ